MSDPITDYLEKFLLKHKTEWNMCIDLSDERPHDQFAVKNCDTYYAHPISQFRDYKYKPRPHQIICVGDTLEQAVIKEQKSHLEMVLLVQKMYMTCLSGAFITLPFNTLGVSKGRLYATSLILEAIVSVFVQQYYSLRFFSNNKQIPMSAALTLSSGSTCLLEIDKTREVDK